MSEATHPKPDTAVRIEKIKSSDRGIKVKLHRSCYDAFVDDVHVGRFDTRQQAREAIRQAISKKRHAEFDRRTQRLLDIKKSLPPDSAA